MSNVGYLYIVASASGLFKIGYTNDIENRVSQIKSASPVKCELLISIKCDNAEFQEKEYHQTFQKKRVRGEWFALSRKDLSSIIRDKETNELLNEMESWGFFDLGTKELFENPARASMWRMQALSNNRRINND